MSSWYLFKQGSPMEQVLLLAEAIAGELPPVNEVPRQELAARPS